MVPLEKSSHGNEPKLTPMGEAPVSNTVRKFHTNKPQKFVSDLKIISPNTNQLDTKEKIYVDDKDDGG